ncbi:MAG: ATP-binding cassette domain-containing protein, partial [Atribacterota bacterium]|nr:ATP-binding cassette domain-containing protein [Atribacterota bacterium]
MVATQQTQPLISLKNVSKSFPGIQALNDISLDIFPGEIHAVLGENGAGKSTLMKILSGIVTKDSGEIFLQG